MTKLKHTLNSEQAERTLRELLWHNPEDGRFYWKVARSKRIKKGDVAGSPAPYGLVITVDGVQYAAHRLAWLFAYGYWPTQVKHLDGDKTNNRIDNLI